MFARSKLTSKNQVTLPAAVRRALGVGPGDRLSYELRDDGQIYLRKDASSLSDLSGIVESGVSLNDDELRHALDDARDELGGLGGRA